MDLDDAMAQVYAATPDQFMAVRTALVGQARAAGDRTLGKAIAALRKPTKSAWLVNLLARSAPVEVAALLDLGSALREAQAALSGPELRRLSRERQQAVQALTRQAGELAAEHDQRATEAQLLEVSQHLQAALADPDLAADVRAGRVTQIVTVGGFGPWEAAAVVTPAAPTTPATKVTKGDPTTAAEPDRSAEAQLRAARRAEALEAWEHRQDELREAEAAARSAATDAAAASAEAERLRTELAGAEQSAADADQRRKEAEQQLDSARKASEEATRRLEALSDVP